MPLPVPPQQYSYADQSQTRALLDNMDQKNRKTGRDLEIAGDERLILTDSVTGNRGVISVAAGVITWTAI